jgi:O-antigen/teichoic acid export membrane protein
MQNYLKHLRRRALGNCLRFNAGSKLGAEIIGRALQFLLAYLAQRALGPAGYGDFTYALSVGIVLSPLTDLGVQLIVTREIARNPAQADRITGAGLILKLALTLLAGLILISIGLARPIELQIATIVLGLALIFNSFVEFFGYALRGLQRVEFDAAFTLFLRLLTVSLGLGALSLNLGLGGLTVAYFISGLIAAVISYLVLRRRFFTPALKIDWGINWQLLKSALPLGGAIVCSILYTRSAIFLLDALKGSTAVGLYAVAQKLTEPLAIFPAAILAAVFPAFSQALTGDIDRAKWLRRRTVWLLSSAGLAIAVAGFVGGAQLIEFLYRDQYAGSTIALQLLALATLFTFINYALTHFLVALNLQRWLLLFNLCLLLLNVVLCLSFIPPLGATGAALATLFSEGLLSALCIITLVRHPLNDKTLRRLNSEIVNQH